MSDIEKVNDLLTRAEVFYLATVDGDKPKVSRMGWRTHFKILWCRRLN